MHRSYGLQGSLKRRYKHPSLLPSMGTTRQKSSCRNGLQNGPCSLSRAKAGTHATPALNRAHNGSHAETGGVSDGGGITTLGAFRTFTNIPGPGIRKVYFAAFGPWPRVLPKNTESLGTAMCLCASLSRGVAAPLGCVIFLQFGDVAVFSLCAQHFLNVQGWGGITTLGVLCVLPKRRTTACQKGSFAIF